MRGYPLWLMHAVPVIRALAVLLVAVVTALTGDELLLDGAVRAAVLQPVNSVLSFKLLEEGQLSLLLPYPWA